ncbi:MAG: carbon-nitrogen hydrolase [Verrucomicrobiales bacterium]|jgi:N-carbamoylputrescine amidase|nr:carbon-nitrogen hydrolase [Verrucomicrobiales bacterium]
MSKRPHRNVKVGLVQFASARAVEQNLRQAAALCRRAADGGAQIICLQELFRSDYFCVTEDYRQFDLAETIPGPSTAALSAVAKDCGAVIIASLFEKRAGGLYHNTAAVLDADGALLGVYRKMHIPDDPAFYEKFYFTPGDLGFKVFDTKFGRLGVLVCWDQWYPEAARLTALRGAEMLFYPTAIGWATGEQPAVRRAQHDAWRTIQRAHAIANGVFTVSVNRVGTEGPLEFWGGSFACDPFGEMLCEASHDREEVLVADLNLADVDHTRKHWPFLRDRRIDAYGELTRRFID